MQRAGFGECCQLTKRYRFDETAPHHSSIWSLVQETMDAGGGVRWTKEQMWMLDGDDDHRW
jgi:hypothetical protein